MSIVRNELNNSEDSNRRNIGVEIIDDMFIERMYSYDSPYIYGTTEIIDNIMINTLAPVNELLKNNLGHELHNKSCYNIKSVSDHIKKAKLIREMKIKQYCQLNDNISNINLDNLSSDYYKIWITNSDFGGKNNINLPIKVGKL